MADITNKKAIFFVTSPRTPDASVKEVKLLVENFSNQVWNDKTQHDFYLKLSQQDFFNGSSTGDLAFKARDRINRAPKSLGFIDLNPVIRLTDVGRRYIEGIRFEETFLKQLLKFQFPSPFHVDKDFKFNVKPYLELIRFIYELDGLSKTEIALYVMQLTNYELFTEIKDKILAFRNEWKSLQNKKMSYKTYVANSFNTELRELFSEEISEDNIFIREKQGSGLDYFLSTKRKNHLDYADAAIRYLRATGLFSIDPLRNKIYVSKDRVKDVEFICNNIDRKVYSYEDEEDYKKYLYDPTNIKLLVDDKDLLLQKISSIDPKIKEGLESDDIELIKDRYQALLNEKLTSIKHEEVTRLQTYEDYENIIEIYEKIKSREITDPPLFFEWNTWRAFTMLDDGEIAGNFTIDDDGLPLYTAPGNKADIVCTYDTFNLIVEVTMSSGHRQYNMEGEPVARHLGNAKRETEKDVYCIFIAPNISSATLAHYYALHRIKLIEYGGTSKIIPLSLDVFKKMLKNASSASNKPNADDMKRFLDQAVNLAVTAENEVEWIENLNSTAASTFL